jgi:predicted transcriptional regulator of viral defense system
LALTGDFAKVTEIVTLVDSLTIKGLPDHLLGQGRYTATTDEIAERLGIDGGAVRAGMNRLRKQHLAFSPARGLYGFVPPSYRSWGVLPADWFIDDLMRYLKRDYYVGLLSAAARHGAAHQRPQVFQVVTGKSTANRDIGRIRLRFFKSSEIAQATTETVTTPTGTMALASKETTVSDLVAHPKTSGGFSNIATIIREIGDLDSGELARLSAVHPRSHARRLGWLVERYSVNAPDLSALELQAAPDRGAPSPLSPSGPRRGQVDKRWGLWVNAAVEPDI